MAAKFDKNARNPVRTRRALQQMAAGNLAHAHVGNEVPTGTLNGVNVTFTLAAVPLASSVQLFRRGLFMSQGAGDDYTISGATITFSEAPAAGENLRAFYIKA
jgi:hypothetical protein